MKDFFKIIGKPFTKALNFCTKTKLRKRVSITITVLLILSIVLGWYVYPFLKIDKTIIDYNNLGIPTNLDDLIIKSRHYNKDDNLLENTITVALFGIDSRDREGYSENSDTIIIMNYNKTNGTIRFASILRDTGLHMPDADSVQKANYAYASGGAQKAIQMLNTNFDLNITEFITVDFWGFEKAIDAIGGVDLVLKRNEHLEVNKYIRDIAIINGDDPDDPKKAPVFKTTGNKHMNGRQALAYSRIRKVGNDDYERTERQAKVIKAAMSKVLESYNPLKVRTLVDSLYPFITTSMSSSQLLGLATSAFTNDIKTQWQNFPKEVDIIEIPTDTYMIEIGSERTKRKIFDFLFFGKNITSEKYIEKLLEDIYSGN